jgi:DNA gyrase subunit A
MEIGNVRLVDIETEMQDAYLDYAMSVIVSRALPDVRDGLKPVHRRILYAMHDMGLRPNAPYKKSARIVGEVLGKYHPHGDQAVYEAMVRMAQDFSMRYMLVDGQGNFGSIDGDSPAAMRYTEARPAAMAEEMLADIQRETVDFGPNFDGTLTEPFVLPAAFPNLLVNGSSGIAVGMTTNIPPHNLGEICDALVYMIDRYKKIDDISAEDLMQFIKGPDFPTGGIVYRYGEEDGNGEQPDLIHSAYAMGRGRITVQAKTHIEEMSRSRHRIVVTELPYQVNKSRLIERIAELVRDGRIEGIADLRDESDRQGMRLVIELTRTVEPRQVLSRLFKLTPLQDTFSIRMLALVKGEPRLLPLKRALQHYIEHRLEIIVRRSRYELDRAKERAHILEGLVKALANLDEVIATIRRSRDVDTARTNLQRKFELSQVQAQAILDMPLRRLAALERKKLEQEYKEKQQLIKYLQGLLRSPSKMLALIKEELLELKGKYSDGRRTQIVEREKGELTTHDLLPEEEVLISITWGGVIKREPAAEKHKIAPKGQDQNATQFLLLANTRHNLAFFTAGGQAGLLPVHQIPDVAQRRAGTPVAGLWPLGRKKLTAVVALPGGETTTEQEGGYLVLATQGGKIKRITLADFVNAAAKGAVTAMSVDHSDELRWARLTQGGQEIILVTKNGQAIRFSEEEVRPMGLAAAGVMAIKLAKGDQVVAVDLVQPRAQLLVATTRGYAKRTPLADFPVQRRYGNGVVAAKLSSRVGQVAAAKVAYAKDRVAFLSAKGTLMGLTVQKVDRMSRPAQGKAVMQLKDGDSLAAIVALEGSPVAEE